MRLGKQRGVDDGTPQADRDRLGTLHMGNATSTTVYLREEEGVKSRYSFKRFL